MSHTPPELPISNDGDVAVIIAHGLLAPARQLRAVAELLASEFDGTGSDRQLDLLMSVKDQVVSMVDLLDDVTQFGSASLLEALDVCD